VLAGLVGIVVTILARVSRSYRLLASQASPVAA
jgi:hypothetical protein